MSLKSESLPAQLAGDKTFIASTPCANGHYERYATDKPRCVECERRKASIAHAMNPSKQAGRYRNRVLLNPNYNKENYIKRILAA